MGRAADLESDRAPAFTMKGAAPAPAGSDHPRVGYAPVSAGYVIEKRVSLL
jgi:hypothetical protein